jgi:NADPH2:quinone reductase
MRAFAVRTFGQSPGICDLPIPGAEGSVLVRVSYAGVNPVDVQLADQLTSNSAFPFVLGVDVAGVVERVPAQATDLRVGDRVFGMARTHGSYAEYTAVPPGARTEPLARIPDGVADEQAAVLPVAAIAALGSLDSSASPPGSDWW